jgi:general nucleoside transport system permease protein
MISRLGAIGSWARPVLSVLVGLALAGIIMAASGYAVRDAYAALWTGATGLEGGPAQRAGQIALGPLHLNEFLLAQSLAKATPLLFIGLAIALGLRAGLFNIGAQGQMTCGALSAAVVGLRGGSLPVAIHMPLILLAGIVGGALWGGLAGWLKAARGVHEVLSTIMLNYVAVNIASYLSTHNLKDPTEQAAQTALLDRSVWLTPLVAGSNLTVGLLLALTAAAFVALLIGRTATGYQIRAMGLGLEAGRAAGIPVARTLILTLALSGGLAGLAGAVEVVGVQHRYLQGIAANYGFDGIAVALLGGLSALAVVLSALFFGALASGSTYMQLQTDVPDSIAVIVQATVILFVGIRLLGRSAPARVGVIPEPAAEPETSSETVAETSQEAKHAPL